MSSFDRFNCLTLALCNLRCEVGADGPVDTRICAAWHSALHELNLGQADPDRPYLEEWGSDGADPNMMALYVGEHDSIRVCGITKTGANHIVKYMVASVAIDRHTARLSTTLNLSKLPYGR